MADEIAQINKDVSILEIQDFIRRGNLEAAELACRALITKDPRHVTAWSILGWICMRQARWTEAEAVLLQATALNPNSAHEWSNLSLAVRQLHRGIDAESYARRAAHLEPANPGHWINLGGALATQLRWEEAAAAYSQALACDVNNATAWQCFGQAEQSLNRLETAYAAYERSLTITPDNWDLTLRFTNTLLQAGMARRACEVYQRYLQRVPQSLAGWMAYGQCCLAIEELGQAETAFKSALAIKPGDAQTCYLLASVLFSRWQLSDAEATIRQVVNAHPEEAAAWTLLGGIQHAQGKINEALKSLRYGVMQGVFPDNHSRLLATMQYADDAHPAKLLEAHRQWDELYAQKLAPTTSAPRLPHAATRPLRLGFVSADFRQHPVAFLALPALERLDKARFQVVCYAGASSSDAYTARFRTAADTWHSIPTLSDEELATQIRKDEIDVLFDLMGHAGCRLLVFARRPAPVQITWLGYVGTTGLRTMDYLLADPFHIREDEECNYVERVLRMPHGYACYGPPTYAPDVNSLPAISTGQITFGCFNNVTKFAGRILNAWAAILNRVPNSRLFFKYGSLIDSAVQQCVRKQFADLGISADRILIEAGAPHAEFLAAYNRVDLALDTQPYSGGLTTCEALWMGVPVITCPGHTFASRHSMSHLSNAGFHEFIAQNSDSYVELAVEWANRLEDLATIRGNMREQVRRSPLCNAARFAADFTALLESLRV